MKPLISLLLLCAIVRAEQVTTLNGIIQGKADGNTTAYLGVPFAAPPSGAYRWRPPQPVIPWQGVRPTTAFPSPCAQIEKEKVIGKEDCLYLNVWVPKNSGPLPVMVFIHGGGLMSGSSSLSYYHGAALAERGGVIVVTVQYRLAELGYLAHPSLSAETSYGGSGNYGLMDQAASLQWVRSNISAFRGDPNNVTLFGESGGAASACALLASPETRNLFSRVILESMTCPAIRQAQAEQEGLRMASQRGCPGSSSSTMSCLRSKPLSVLMQTSMSEMIMATDFRRTPQQINVDRYWLPDLPLALYRSGRSQPVPLIIGSNAIEGLLVVPLYASPSGLRSQLTKFYGKANTNALYSLYSSYPGFLQAVEIAGDALFDCRTRRLARAKKMGNSAPVYRYLYDFTPELAPGITLPATHGMELPFVFQNFSQIKPTLDANDKIVESHFLNYWIGFARTGNPNSAAVPSWEEHVPAQDNLLKINTAPSMTSAWKAQKCDLWDQLDDL